MKRKILLKTLQEYGSYEVSVCLYGNHHEKGRDDVPDHMPEVVEFMHDQVDRHKDLMPMEFHESGFLTWYVKTDNLHFRKMYTTDQILVPFPEGEVA